MQQNYCEDKNDTKKEVKQVREKGAEMKTSKEEIVFVFLESLRKKTQSRTNIQKCNPRKHSRNRKRLESVHRKWPSKNLRKLTLNIKTCFTKTIRYQR